MRARQTLGESHTRATGRLEVNAAGWRPTFRLRSPPQGRGPATLLLNNLLRGLLGEHRRLDAVKKSLKPSDQLCLREAEFAFAWSALAKRQTDSRKLGP